MDTKKGFKDLIVWQKSHQLYLFVATDCLRFPRNRVVERLSYQLLGSAGSVSANIAEGYGRGGSKEFKQFLVIARGSLEETDNWLLKALELKLLKAEKYEEYLNLKIEIAKMLTVLIGKLKEQSK